MKTTKEQRDKWRPTCGGFEQFLYEDIEELEKRLEICKMALDRFVKETDRTPLVTDGCIKQLRQALAASKWMAENS